MDTEANAFNKWWWSDLRTVACAKATAHAVWQAAVSLRGDEVIKLRAENERLRAALDEAVKQIEHLAIETNARAAMVNDVSMQLGKLGRETWAALNAPAKEPNDE